MEVPSRSSFASIQNILHEFIMLHWVLEYLLAYLGEPIWR